METYDLLIPEEYTTKERQVRSKFYQVGIAFPMKEREGFTINIAPGAAISGKVLLVKRTPRDQEPYDPQTGEV